MLFHLSCVLNLIVTAELVVFGEDSTISANHINGLDCVVIHVDEVELVVTVVVVQHVVTGKRSTRHASRFLHV